MMRADGVQTADVPDDAAAPLTDEHRHILRAKIAQGVRSLRDGKGVDGESFMAAIDAELAELERPTPTVKR